MRLLVRILRTNAVTAASRTTALRIEQHAIRSALIVSLLLLPAMTSGAAVVPTGDEVILGTATSAIWPVQVAWTGSRFAVVYVESETVPPARILLRYIEPLSDVATAPIELAALGATPLLAAFPDGSLVVAWTDYDGWYARFVDSTGTPGPDAFPLGLADAGSAAIAAGSNGEWVFVFQRHAEIAGMRYHDVTPATEEPFLVASGSDRPTVAMLPDNRFLVSWTETVWDEGCDDCGYECCFDWHDTYVLGRGFDPDGAPENDVHHLSDFHNDEEGLNGAALLRAGSTGYVGAWLDSYSSDTPGQTYIVLRPFDETGIGAANSRVLAGIEPDPYGISLSLSLDQAVIATAQPQFDEEWGYAGDEVEIYSTSPDAGPVEKLSLATPDSTYEWLPLLAGNEDGALLLVWQRNNDLGFAAEIVARPLFAAPAILCGDANYDRILRATDGLATLRTAVGLRYCAPQVCDTTGDGAITASDASRVLRAAVGIESDTACPPTGEAVPPPFQQDASPMPRSRR